MKNIWSLLCRKALIDSQTNTISLIDSFEEIEIGIDPSAKGKNVNVVVDFELVSYWIKDKNDTKNYLGSVEVTDPNNKILGSFPFSLDFANSNRLRARLQFSSMIVTVQGEYIFHVKYKSEDEGKFTKATEIPLLVKVVETINNLKSNK
ncbi:MAG: hypothetical protein A2808_03520 [Candidatus Moranbacteria bacterium RIFCSPHIGHO2_01_FULL_55_24]|nr:MAG: hypothetical protein A2808_03520 [Candidatus Moranbacteria bacterium RIFCSPHIGHO2_01_FULL_55_24]